MAEKIVKDSQGLAKELVNDCISRQAAIDALDKRFDSIPMEQTTEILQLRKDLRELPSAQQKQCEYCNEDSEGYVKPIEKNGHAFVRFGMNGWELELKANGWHGSAKIRYCPMCGRDLFVK